MKFGTLLVTGQLILGAVIGLIAAALAVWGNNEGLVAVLTAGSMALILFGLIMATTFPQVARTVEGNHDD